MSGRLVVLSGPSGVGKDTVLAAWSRINPLVERIVTVTTRPPSEDESDGVDYHFVDKATFDRMVDAGEFLESKEVHGNWYGSPASAVKRLLGEGKVAVLKIDVQGAAAVMGIRPDALTVFLLPPDNATLERRIRARGRDDEPTIQRRLHNALSEMAQADRYQHRVVNETVEETACELQAILEAHR